MDHRSSDPAETQAILATQDHPARQDWEEDCSDPLLVALVRVLPLVASNMCRFVDLLLQRHIPQHECSDASFHRLTRDAVYRHFCCDTRIRALAHVCSAVGPPTVDVEDETEGSHSDLL